MIGCAVLALALQGGAGLSAADAVEFASIVTAVITEPDAARRSAIAARATPFQARADMADLVALVRAGPRVPVGLPEPRTVGGARETIERFGDVVSGLSFAFGAHTYRYAVDVPKSYDATRPCGVLLDPGHGSAADEDARGKAGYLEMFRRHATEAGCTDWLVVRTEIVEQVGAEGRFEALPEDQVAAVFDAFFRDLSTRFRIDPDRVIANGLSQTGFWSWYLGRANPRRFQALIPMSAVTWEVDLYAANFLGTTIAVLHGSDDPVCPAAGARGTVALLQRLGGGVRYVEVPGAKHEYAVWGQEPKLLETCAAKPRARYPKSGSFSVQTLAQPWCGPIRIDELERVGDGQASTGPTGGVDFEIEGQDVRLYVSGVKALTLALSGDEIDLSRPVRVSWNGRRAFQGKFEPSVQALLENAGDTCDWSATRETRIALKAP